MSRSLMRILPRMLRNNVFEDRGFPRSVTPFMGSSWGGLDVFDREFRRMDKIMDRMMNQMQNEFMSDPFFRRAIQQTQDAEGLFRVVDENGKKKLLVQFDAENIKPEHIEVKTSGNRLEISGKTEEKSEHHSHYQEFSRILTLPEGVQADQMSCRFEDGVVTLEAPYNPPALEGQESKDIEVKKENREPVRKEIPIKREGSQQQ